MTAENRETQKLNGPGAIARAFRRVWKGAVSYRRPVAGDSPYGEIVPTALHFIRAWTSAGELHMIEYTRDGHSTYHFDEEHGRWMRTHLYGFSPPITGSQTLAGHDEEQGRAWLLANGWVASGAQ